MDRHPSFWPIRQHLQLRQLDALTTQVVNTTFTSSSTRRTRLKASHHSRPRDGLLINNCHPVRTFNRKGEMLMEHRFSINYNYPLLSIRHIRHKDFHPFVINRHNDSSLHLLYRQISERSWFPIFPLNKKTRTLLLFSPLPLMYK